MLRTDSGSPPADPAQPTPTGTETHHPLGAKGAEGLCCQSRGRPSRACGSPSSSSPTRSEARRRDKAGPPICSGSGPSRDSSSVPPQSPLRHLRSPLMAAEGPTCQQGQGQAELLTGQPGEGSSCRQGTAPLVPNGSWPCESRGTQGQARSASAGTLSHLLTPTNRCYSALSAAETSSAWKRDSPHRRSLSSSEQSQDKHRALRAPHASMSGRLWAPLCSSFSGARMSAERWELARTQSIATQGLLGFLLFTPALAMTKQLLRRQRLLERARPARGAGSASA